MELLAPDGAVHAARVYPGHQRNRSSVGGRSRQTERDRGRLHDRRRALREHAVSARDQPRQATVSDVEECRRHQHGAGAGPAHNARGISRSRPRRLDSLLPGSHRDRPSRKIRPIHRAPSAGHVWPRELERDDQRAGSQQVRSGIFDQAAQSDLRAGGPLGWAGFQCLGGGRLCDGRLPRRQALAPPRLDCRQMERSMPLRRSRELREPDDDRVGGGVDDVRGRFEIVGEN